MSFDIESKINIMSYKDVRDLFEYLQILGYPKHLKVSTLYTTQGSLENFKLIFDIMRWLIDQFEPGTVLSGGADTEIDRILLVRSAVEFLVIKAAIKLNPLRLYSGTAAAACELLKVVNLILKRPTIQLNESNDKQYRKLGDIDIDDKVKARQRGRELSSELTHLGATLYDLLGKENENQEKRNAQAGRQMEQSNADKILSGVVTTANLKLSGDKGQLEAVLVEKQAISAKVERKKADLERLRQRLDTLQKIRPAFSEEFERAEEELQKLYGSYFTHIRCLDALRAQTNINTKTVQPVADAIKSGSAPQSMILLPDGILDLSDDVSDDGNELDEIHSDLKLKQMPQTVDTSISANGHENGVTQAKLRIKTGVGRKDEKRFIGSMNETGNESDLDSSLELNDDDSDSESDPNDEHLMNDTVDNVEALYNFSETAGARKSAKTKLYQSDEDF